MFNFSKSQIPCIQPEEVKKTMDSRENFILLDVRTPGEFSRGKLAGSINLPVNEVSEKVESIIPDKTSLVYVYCLSGSRSATAVEIMLNLGYSNVFDMPHGLLAWRVKGYPVDL